MSEGKWLVVGLLSMACLMSGAAVWYQRAQSRPVLEHWGTSETRAIETAERVELIWLSSAKMASDGAAKIGNVWYESSVPVTVGSTPGFSHLRNALLENISYQWTAPLPTDVHWEFGLDFVQEKQTVRLIFAPKEKLIAIGNGSRAVVMGPIIGRIEEYLRGVASETAEDAESHERNLIPGESN